MVRQRKKKKKQRKRSKSRKREINSSLKKERRKGRVRARKEERSRRLLSSFIEGVAARRNQKEKGIIYSLSREEKRMGTISIKF